MGTIDEVTFQKKQQLRKQAVTGRDNLLEVDEFSRMIWDKLLALPQFINAKTVMTYLDFDNEVRTSEYLPELWRMKKRVVVPYCTGNDIHLFRLENINELSPGAWRILEPKPELRRLPDRSIRANQLDLIIVPGVAFDSRGNRLGMGKGYYDRFLRHVRPDVVKAALAFECQMVKEVPTTSHDIRMNMIITEKGIYVVD